MSANGDMRGTAPLDGFIVDRLPSRSRSSVPSSFQVRNVVLFRDDPEAAGGRVRVEPGLIPIDGGRRRRQS